MRIQEKLGAGVLSLGLVVGLSGFAGATTGTIDTTGPDSTNTIRSEMTHRVDVDNDNKVKLHNNNDQEAWTGDARVQDNTTGGDAWTGEAWNDNALDVSASIDNSSSTAGAWSGGMGGGDHHHDATISNTGPDSVNRVVFDTYTNVDIENDNEVYVTNNNTQTASSGDATVRHNTTGGDAVTGDATNVNSTSVSVDIAN